MLVLLLAAATIVWLAVISAATRQPSATRASNSSPDMVEPKEQQASPKARSETGVDAQAKSRQALEEDIAAQENFTLPVEGKSQGIIASDGGAGRREKASATSPQANYAFAIVTAKTCSGAPIELYVGEKRMLDLHNQTRAQHSLSPLCVHPALTKAARAYSQDMLDRDYFSHYSPEGSDPTDRVRQAGYTSCGRTSMCGENLAVGTGYSSTPDDLFEALMNSPGHRANILRKEFREVGIGLRAGSYNKYEGTASMYSVEFAGRVVGEIRLR